MAAGDVKKGNRLNLSSIIDRGALNFADKTALVLDDHLRDKTASNPSVTEFRRMCIERGMVTLREDGFKKVAKGMTTVEEVLRVTESTI